MVRFVLSFFGGIFSWVTTAIAAGVLTIGAVFWLYGQDLPSTASLASYEPPTISRIYSVEGEIIDEFARERRLFVPIEDIPDVVKQAFISAEDKSFYEHAGFDPRGMVSAARDAVLSGGADVRGASTITQQVMKNFLLSGDRTAERKVRELILANRVEKTLTKDDILELYLNEIDLGFRSFGVASAAQTYFNKTLEQLTVGEAAYLAGLPKAPYSYHPVRNTDAAVARRNYVLREMMENGYIDRATYTVERAAPLRTVQSGDFESFRFELPPRDYFTDEIRRQLSADFGEEQFFTGGLSIRATIDPDMQVVAARALREALEDYDRSLGRWRGSGKSIPEEQLGEWQEALSGVDIARDIDLESPWLPAVVLDIADQTLTLGIEGWKDGDPAPTVPRDDIAWMKGDFFENFERGDVVHVRRMTADGDGSFIRWTLRQVPQVQGAFMAMDVNSGRVIAMQGGFSYQDSVFNRATQAMRQPGSSFKPFVYAAALDSGYTPATVVVDGPIEVNTPDGVWRPKNASNKYYGPTPMRTGIEQSRNLMTIRLAQEVGMETIAAYAERFGVYDKMKPYISNALGSEETTLFRMVAAYSMFANGGERVQPTLVDRVQDRRGNTIYRHDDRTCLECGVIDLAQNRAPKIVSNRARVMDPITAYQLTSMMEGVVRRGTARSTVGAAISEPVAGKTGTTNDAKDVWFVGFTSNIAAGCYIGYDNPKSLGAKAGGGGMCGPVFAHFMKEAIAKYGAGQFAVPPGGTFVKIDRHTGARLSDDATGDNVIAEYFRQGLEPSYGVLAAIDGGWSLGGDIPLFAAGEEDEAPAQQVRNSAGKTVTVAPKASFGSMSGGGLY